MLDKGPNFALPQKVDRSCLERAESGLERAIYGLRWRNVRETKQQTVPQVPQGGLSQNTSSTGHSKLRPMFPDTPAYQPPRATTQLESELKDLKTKVLKAYKYHNRVSNKRSDNYAKQREVLRELKNNDTLIVKPSDKCKGFVVLNKTDYIEKARTITDDYQSIPSQPNPTKRLEIETCTIIKETLSWKLHKDTVLSLLPHSSRTAELYGLPKTP